MTVNRNAIYGDYAEGYCEDWSPVGSPALFTAAGGVVFDPSRLPAYPTYVMRWEQAVTESAGADTVVHAPYLQELLIRLSWPSMSKEDKLALEAFFASAAVAGMSGQFSYYNPMHGPAVPVRFAAGSLPLMPEIAFERYRVELTLRVDINYPQMTATGAPPAIQGNRFVIGGAAFAFSPPVRPSTGYGVETPQTMERNSAGEPVVYRKSRLTLKAHRYAMVLDYDAFIRLQSCFFSFAHGCRNLVTWYDQSGASRTVRLAAPEITVKQLGYDRYAAELDLVEEL